MHQGASRNLTLRASRQNYIYLSAPLFEMIEGDGDEGHYMRAFGTPEDMRVGRETLVAESGMASSGHIPQPQSES